MVRSPQTLAVLFPTCSAVTFLATNRRLCLSLQDTMFVSTKNPRELFATNQQEERLKLSHVLSPCSIQMQQPMLAAGSSDLADVTTHFCMYHFDHRGQ